MNNDLLVVETGNGTKKSGQKEVIFGYLVPEESPITISHSICGVSSTGSADLNRTVDHGAILCGFL